MNMISTKDARKMQIAYSNPASILAINEKNNAGKNATAT